MGVEPNLHSPNTRRGPETTGDVCGELASMIYARLMVNFEVKLTLHDFNTFLPREHMREVLGVIILSVCLSVTRVDCDKSKWCTADILIPYERPITLLL